MTGAGAAATPGRRLPRARATEPELMLRVQADDVDALGALFDLLGPRALGVAHAVCGDRDRAEDVVQEAFVSVWRGRAAYRGERGEVHAWVLGIVRNRAIDSLRRERRHARERHHGGLEKIPARGNVEDNALHRDQARRLRMVLAELPIAQREVIALAYFGELSHSEIARELDVPMGTVKGRMRLGLNKLRGHMIPEAVA